MEFGIGWCLIPPHVLADSRLSHLEKMIFGRVLGLLGERGFCFASNEWLGKQFGCTDSSVSKSISNLNKLELVRVEIIKDKSGTERRIFCDSLIRGVGESGDGGSKNFLSGVGKNREYSNRDISNRDEINILAKAQDETVSLPRKGIQGVASVLMDSLKSKQSNTQVTTTYEWQDKALRYAKDLGINWDDKILIEKRVKARWMSLFKRGIGVDKAYSFVVDYNTPLNSHEKIKLFFWKVGH